MTATQLAVAAYCGHPAALAATDGAQGLQAPLEFALGLERFGPQVFLRAAAAAIRSSEPILEDSEKDRLRLAGLLERWLSRPSEALQAELRDAGYVGSLETMGGTLAAVRWALDRHKIHEMDKRGSYVDPAELKEQERVVHESMRKACLDWSFGPPW